MKEDTITKLASNSMGKSTFIIWCVVPILVTVIAIVFILLKPENNSMAFIVLPILWVTGAIAAIRYLWIEPMANEIVKLRERIEPSTDKAE